jgi:hypothetical protein
MRALALPGGGQLEILTADVIQSSAIRVFSQSRDVRSSTPGGYLMWGPKRRMWRGS